MSVLDFTKTISNGVLEKAKSFRGNWNENDETNPAYIKNRPFYETNQEITLIDGVYEGFENWDGSYGWEGNASFKLIIGQSYTVIWDNMTYTDITAIDSGDGGLFIGDPNDNFATLPFFVFYNDNDGYFVFCTNSTANSHSVKITTIQSEIIKIDKKYLPGYDNILLKVEQELTTEEIEQVYKNLKLDDFPTQEQVENLYKTLSSDRTLRFYCVENVTVVLNGVSTVYPANSSVEIKFLEDDVFEVIPTSDNSILALNGFPGALGVYYSWLEGVKQFSNILFDMNNVEMYSKWSQGNQGMYQVQYAQYTNCIFWSDNPYISDVTKRTNYTLYNSSQLPLCYSNIPDNTFKAFYLALGVNNDPNWSNPVYKESFAKATYATQAFSYYGARVIGTPEHFSIALPTDCRGLMFYARNTEAAGTFDATNVTNFGAKSGSWREAFGHCSSLRRLYITNLKVSLNISWSPIDYDSIYFIISNAANTGAITISVSPYTYNLLSQADFDLATSKNITIELLTTNYTEDKRLGEIANKADKSYVDNQIAGLVNAAPETLDTLGELATAFTENKEVVDALDEAITNKANIAIVPTNLINGSSEGSLRGVNTLAEDDSYTIGINAFAIGNETKASGKNSFASGQGTVASGSYSHVEGYGCTATAVATHAEGYDTHAIARYAHSEGASTTASGNNSHAEGNSTVSSGHYSHAEGNGSVSSGGYAHAEGNYTTASETFAHAEGSNTTASGTGAHAEGNYTVASGTFAHAEGYYTLASSDYQHVRGDFNIEDKNKVYSTIVGNGTGDNTRSNAYTLDHDGNGWFAGNVYVGSTSGTNKDEGSKKLATEEYVDIRVPAWTEADEGKFLCIVNNTPTWSTVTNAEEVMF